MNILSLCFTLILLCGLASASLGSYTIYYSDTSVLNADGSITVTPTVTVSGTDNSWCNNGTYGWDVPAVMLNGNAWSVGPAFDSGIWGGNNLEYDNTFPEVTLPADGTPVDMSYAGKVQGTCFSINDDEPAPPWTESAFFLGAFNDGTAPNVLPAPCWIIVAFTPNCPTSWPSLWSGMPHHLSNVDLGSLKVPWDARTASTLVKMIPGTESNCFSALGFTFCDYNTNIWCTPATTPPLYQPAGVHDVPKAVPNPAYYWLARALCERVPPAPWSCVGVVPSLGFAAQDNYPKYACSVP